MRKITIATLILCFYSIAMLAQDAAKEPKRVQIVYLLPKPGMSQKFEEAVKKHNEKYHKDSPHQAMLETIITGQYAGWYVWEMGPFNWSDLDNRPGKGAHDDDWDKTVTPLVAKSKFVEYWASQTKLSNEVEGAENNYSEIWFIDLKRGDYYRFKAVMENIKAVQEKLNKPLGVYTNSFYAGDGREIALVFGFKSWADLDTDSKFKETYEELHGEGSWQVLSDEWEEITEEIIQEIWKVVE